MPNEPAREASAPRPTGPAQMQVKWDDSNLKSSYANVCNVASTREEVVLLFGINQAWRTGQPDVTIQLTDRIILSPFAAKRLAILLNNLVKEHESRFGALPMETQRPSESTAS